MQNDKSNLISFAGANCLGQRNISKMSHRRQKLWRLQHDQQKADHRSRPEMVRQLQKDVKEESHQGC